MGQMEKLDKGSILEFLKSCHHKCGGFSSSTGHDPHILYTLSAVQVISLLFVYFSWEPKFSNDVWCVHVGW